MPFKEIHETVRVMSLDIAHAPTVPMQGWKLLLDSLLAQSFLGALQFSPYFLSRVSRCCFLHALQLLHSRILPLHHLFKTSSLLRRWSHILHSPLPWHACFHACFLYPQLSRTHLLLFFYVLVLYLFCFWFASWSLKCLVFVVFVWRSVGRFCYCFV